MLICTSLIRPWYALVQFGNKLHAHLIIFLIKHGKIVVIWIINNKCDGSVTPILFLFSFETGICAFRTCCNVAGFVKWTTGWQEQSLRNCFPLTNNETRSNKNPPSSECHKNNTLCSFQLRHKRPEANRGTFVICCFPMRIRKERAYVHEETKLLS